MVCPDGDTLQPVGFVLPDTTGRYTHWQSMGSCLLKFACCMEDVVLVPGLTPAECGCPWGSLKPDRTGCRGPKVPLQDAPDPGGQAIPIWYQTIGSQVGVVY